MLTYIANVKVGNETVTCVISSSFNYSAISIDFLNKLNLDYKKMEKDKSIYLGSPKYTHPLGNAIIPIQFDDAKKRNVTIASEIYVCNKNIPLKNYIILGYDWLIGGGVEDKNKDVQLYKIKLAHEFIWGGEMEAYLSIRRFSRLKLYKNCAYSSDFDLYAGYDSSDDADDSSDDDSDDESLTLVVKKKKVINHVNESSSDT